MREFLQKSRAVKSLVRTGKKYSVLDGDWAYTFSANRYEYHQTVNAGYDKFIFSGKSKQEGKPVYGLQYIRQF